MLQCETCKHGIFCPTWGDYKCAALHLSHTSAMLDEPCEHYTKTIYPNEKQPKCRCNDCETRDKEDIN